MVSPIQPVALTGVTGAKNLAGTAGAATQEAEGSGFGQAIGNALSELGNQSNGVAEAAEAAAVGDLQSVSDYMIAAAEAQLATEITVAVRDRAIGAFNDIMRMQL